MKRSRPVRQLAVPSAAPQRIPMSSACIGWIAGVTPEGHPRVGFPGSPDDLPAASTVEGSRAELEAAAARRQPVVLLFEEGDPERPIVVGFVVTAAPREAPHLVEAGPGAGWPEVAEVDGKRVCIEGADEVVLVCGKASITLRRTGRIVVRGTHVETDADGVNRIKGASVRIN